MKSLLPLALLLFIAFSTAAQSQSSSISPEDLLTSGQAKLDKNDHEGALADYDRAIRLQPDLAAAYFGRGLVLSKQGKANAAVADLSKALELDPNMTDALVARANLLLTRRNDFAGSIADYDKLINLGVGLDESYYHRGLAKARLRDFQGAIADYTAVLELPSRETPKYKPASYKGMAYNARGNARLALSDFEPAIADFTAAINLDSRDGWNYLQRARAFEGKGEHESAQADYDKALEISPELVRFIDAGRDRRSEKTRPVAKNDSPAPDEVEPKTAADYFNRGTAFLQQKDHDSAIADFTKSVERDPKFRDAYFNRGNAFMVKQDFERAIADYSRAIDLAPLEEHAYNNRAIVRQQAGDLAGAIKDFDKAIELAPHFAHLYGDRGIALFLIGRGDEAKRDFEQCLRLDPSVRPWLEGRIRWAERQRTARRQ